MFCPRKKIGPVILVAHQLWHRVTARSAFTCHLPQSTCYSLHILRLTQFAFVNRRVGVLFFGHVTTASITDDSRLKGRDQRYERDKLRTWSNGISSQQMCRQKCNKMRSKMKGRVTLISINTVPPRILPEKQQKISQLWVLLASDLASLNARGASWSVERNCTSCIDMLLIVRPSSVAVRQVS